MGDAWREKNLEVGVGSPLVFLSSRTRTSIIPPHLTPVSRPLPILFIKVGELLNLKIDLESVI